MDTFLNKKVQHMKGSNTPASNVADNFLRREKLLNTKGQYMKESNILVSNNETIK